MGYREIIIGPWNDDEMAGRQLRPMCDVVKSMKAAGQLRPFRHRVIRDMTGPLLSGKGRTCQ